jgi:hypothetical protein
LRLLLEMSVTTQRLSSLSKRRLSGEAKPLWGPAGGEDLVRELLGGGVAVLLGEADDLAVEVAVQLVVGQRGVDLAGLGVDLYVLAAVQGRADGSSVSGSSIVEASMVRTRTSAWLL